MGEVRVIPITDAYREGWDRVFDRSHREVPSSGEAYVLGVEDSEVFPVSPLLVSFEGNE